MTGLFKPDFPVCTVHPFARFVEGGKRNAVQLKRSRIVPYRFPGGRLYLFFREVDRRRVS